MFNSNKKPEVQQLTIEELSANITESCDEVNEKLEGFFNALTSDDIRKGVISGNRVTKKCPSFSVLPSIDFCKKTPAFKSYVELLQRANVEIVELEYNDCYRKLSLILSMKKEFFEKVQPVALLDAPKADALGDELTQSVIVTASQKKQPAII
jgi:hypothetical protein